MANQERGEVDLKVAGETFTLCFTTNAIAEVEQVGGASIVALLASFVTEGRAGTTRLMMWGGLRKFHPTLSLLDAGNLLDDANRDEGRAIGEAIGNALRFRLSALGYEIAGEGKRTDTDS